MANPKKDTDKKQRERQIIEAARKYSTCIPDGELVPCERPDWLIPSALLGIEVSELLPAKVEDTLFSGPQLSSFQKNVVALAEQRYYLSANASPADVLVFFKNDWTNKRDSKIMAHALATFVSENYPSGVGKSVTLQQLTSGVRGWVDGLNVIRILGEKGTWKAGGSNTIRLLSYEELAQRVAAKNLLLPEYRRRLPGWQMWLLLSTRINVLESLSVPREIATWQFNFSFDKVIFSSWENGVIELRTNNTQPSGF